LFFVSIFIQKAFLSYQKFLIESLAIDLLWDSWWVVLGESEMLPQMTDLRKTTVGRFLLKGTSTFSRHCY
jgi:hypothetical protein